MKKLYITALIMAISALIWLYFNFDPQVYSFFPKCPFHMLTGLRCPGCGSQRATHALLHADLRAALRFNILLVLAIPFLLVHWAHLLVSAVQRRHYQWALLYHPLTPKVMFAVVLLFGILRNISLFKTYI